MGRNSSQMMLQTALLAAGVLLAVDQSAIAGSMTFLSPRQVAVRHSGGSLLRGGIKSMSNEEVVVITPTAGEKSVAMSSVTSVIAADGSFKYYPAQEAFDEFLEKSANLRGVTIVRDSAPAGAGAATDMKMIGTVSEGYARAVGMQASATPKVESSSGGFVQAGGFPGPSQRPQRLARLEAPSIPELDSATLQQMEQERKAAELDGSSPKFALPGGGVVPIAPAGPNNKFALPAAGEEVLICSNPNCRKEVPGAKYGQKCPYCGIVWARESAADLAANSANGSSAPVVDPKNPFAKAAAPPPPAPIAVPQAPAAAPVVPAGAAPQGFTLETIPWWGKILGFGASVMVLMWVLGRR